MNSTGLIDAMGTVIARDLRIAMRRRADVSSEQENKSEPDRAAMHVLN